MVRLFITFLTLLLSFNANGSSKSSPANPFIDSGACPFECCKYQKWSVDKDTQLFDKVEGKKQVGFLKKGSKLEAITGEVHIEPNPVEIVFDKGNFSKGDALYLLTPQGEGFYKIWHNGKIDSIETLDLFENSGLPKKCISPSKECWGKPKKSILEQKKTWWIKFKTTDGITGWSKESNNFSGNDSCS